MAVYLNTFDVFCLFSRGGFQRRILFDMFRRLCADYPAANKVNQPLFVKANNIFFGVLVTDLEFYINAFGK